jgi:hypothetical protein
MYQEGFYETPEISKEDKLATIDDMVKDYSKSNKTFHEAYKIFHESVTAITEQEETLSEISGPSLLAKIFFENNNLYKLLEQLVNEKEAKWNDGKFDYTMTHGEFKNLIQNNIPDFKSWTNLSNFILHKGNTVTPGVMNKTDRTPTR